ncbi:MAG: hypothetical protein BRD47_00235 [Bacteroidetes bacterium QS_8_68_28]|nr:MAG: hypothetical protein BRD47_00235 [Bacteroidetes bacterium QS_8_68_28]
MRPSRISPPSHSPHRSPNPRGASLMLKRYLSSSLLTALLLCFVASGLMAGNANAQESRPDGLYIRAKVGANSYAGDRDFNPDNQFGDFFGTDEEENDDINKNPNTSGEGGPASTVDSEGDLSQISFPSVGGEIGYNAKFGFFNGGLALTYVGGRYTDLINANFSGETLPTQNDSPIYVVSEESSEWRHTVGLIGRVGFGGNATVQPYLQLGAQGTFGNVFPITNGAPGDEDDSEWELTFGPMAGIGLDFALTPRLGLFLEATGSGTFPDGNIDLHPGLNEDENGFDILGFYGGGLRYSFGSVFTPVEIVSLDCPAELQAGESGTFTATINEGEATTPISSRWEFGDGTTDTGLVSTKTYNSAGTYTVTFTTSNDGASATRNCTVEVVEPPQPAVVASIDSNPNPSEPGESVSFTSNVRGDRPIDCEWDFGDGETSSNCNPTHTYEEPGSYNVTFTASNEYGSDTASLTQVVEQPQQLARSSSSARTCASTWKASPPAPSATRMSSRKTAPTPWPSSTRTTASTGSASTPRAKGPAARPPRKGVTRSSAAPTRSPSPATPPARTPTTIPPSGATRTSTRRT